MSLVRNVLNFIRKSNIQRVFNSKTYPCRTICANSALYQQNKALSEQNEDDSAIGTDVSESDDVELEQKRNKNRLPERIYRIYIKKESDRPALKIDMRPNRLKKFYGQHGKGSGLNPGLMWPTEQDINDLIEYEAKNELTPQETLKKLAAERAEIQKQRDVYEAEVERNFKKLDRYIEDYYKRIAQREMDAVEAKKKRAALIEEISEILGYDVDPADPKFKEVVEQRHKEKKKAMKEKKQQQTFSKMLEKLAEIAKE